MNVGVRCGHCGGEVYMHACPIHEWAVLSVCRGCLATYKPHDGKCLDCDYSLHAAIIEALIEGADDQVYDLLANPADDVAPISVRPRGEATDA